MLVRNYVQRLRMEAPLRSPPWPDVPAGFILAAWRPDLLRAHAEVKYRSFRHTLDAAIFPNLGVLDGCLKLMRTIAGHDGFVPEATWLMPRPGRPCGCIQGVGGRRRVGMIQNLAVLPECRGLGAGRPCCGPPCAGSGPPAWPPPSSRCVPATGRAVRLYQAAGFVTRKTLYRETRAEYTEYAI